MCGTRVVEIQTLRAKEARTPKKGKLDIIKVIVAFRNEKKKFDNVSQTNKTPVIVWEDPLPD